MISDDFSHVDEWGPEKIVTVAGAVHDPSGLDVAALLQAKDQWGDALVHHLPRAVKRRSR